MLDMMSNRSLFKYPPVAKLLRADQALHNILVYGKTSLFESGEMMLIHNNDTWVHHMHFEAYNRGHFTDSHFPSYGTDAARGILVSRWNLYPTILHQYDRDPLLTNLFDRTLDAWVEAAKVPEMVWCGTGVPKSRSRPETNWDARNCGWQELGADADYIWMTGGADQPHDFHRVPRQSVVIHGA
jgi:hypothetical protein